jgi:hypothetical protein
VALASCPTRKCLTAYVAPWCPHCREATPAIIALRDYLKPRGVTTRVIVGLDKPKAVRDYAATFGPDTILDPAGTLQPGGVPHFYVTDDTGALIKDVPGMPMTDSLDDLAAFFGV